MEGNLQVQPASAQHVEVTPLPTAELTWCQPHWDAVGQLVLFHHV